MNIKLYFSTTWDISTFKRYFHCIMRAERSARVIHLRNKPRHKQFAIIRWFCPKLWCISLPFDIFLRYFHCIMRAERSALVFLRRNKPTHTQIATISRFWRKLCVIPLQFKIFRCLYAVFTALSAQNVVHAFSIIETSQDRRKSQSFFDFEAN